MSRKFTALLVGTLTVLAVERSAEAFCRTTACRSTKSHECPADADGCITEGAPLFWPTSCLSYATNRLGSERLDPAHTRAVIKKSFDAWNDVECPDGTTARMKFEEREPVSCKRSQYNKDGPNVNVVLFQDADWKYRGIDGTLAKTSVTYNDSTGEIYDADIEVNSANNEITLDDPPGYVEYDLQAILTHEVGHFIGIAHSPNPSAVMYASYSPGSLAQRKLNPDDIEAVCQVYPSTDDKPANCEPKGGFSGYCAVAETTSVCSSQPSTAGASYGVASIALGCGLLTIRARRKRRSLARAAVR